MKKITILLGIVCSLFLASCEKETISGNGPIISELRNTGAFTEIRTSGDIKIHINYGATTSVEVRGYSNLVAITEAKLLGNKLYVQYNDKYHSIRNSNIELYITIPALSAVETYGSGDVYMNGFTNGQVLQASAFGSAAINISNSNYAQTKFHLNGSGNVQARELSSGNVEAIIHGSSHIDISCSTMLKARINGSGKIGYWGNPGLDIEITGSGTVTKKG